MSGQMDVLVPPCRHFDMIVMSHQKRFKPSLEHGQKATLSKALCVFAHVH